MAGILTVTVMDYRQDETGQWWYHSPTLRQRAYERSCEGCGATFLSCKKASNRSRFCSVPCANKHTAPIRKPRTGKATYTQDVSGQWWYYASNGTRTRAVTKNCKFCGKDYQINVFHADRSLYCSRSCGGHDTTKMGRGPKSHRWQGGRIKFRGYIKVFKPDHPTLDHKNPKARKYVYEHRLVMEQMIGRVLEKNEYVHHKNGVKDDNRPENLELWVGGHPPGQRVEERKHCPTCTCHEH